MTEKFSAYFTEKQKQINNRLLWPDNFNAPENVIKAMNYSLAAGGKRIRPVLCLMIEDVLRNDFKSANSSDIVNLGLALEYIHTYSLIHDDLPAMDNDNLRRGVPTCHIKFGEAGAILAGDALLTHAFYLSSDLKHCKSIEIFKKIQQFLSISAGAAGMAGGQMLDLEAENREITFEHLKKIHSLKTGKLLEAAVLLPVIYYERNDVYCALEIFSRNIGLSFQIIDDLLDETATALELGKNPGSDTAKKKSTYVSHLGIEGARQEAQRCRQNALSALTAVNHTDTFYLKELAEFINTRSN